MYRKRPQHPNEDPNFNCMAADNSDETFQGFRNNKNEPAEKSS